MHHPEINLVLMDIKMSLLNGYEATKQIKQLRPVLPIIVQTAFASIEDREKAENAGCDGFITKPIDKQKLGKLIEQCLLRSSS
jgi:CheY-like chemotaxis protein